MPQPTATLEDLARITAQTPGCPICRYGRQAGRAFLEGLLYESVNDFGLRQQLVQSLGFCAYHSREMLRFPGARLGAAILEQAMLKEALRRIQTQTPARRSLLRGRRASAAPASNHDGCPVCRHEREAEQRAVEELVADWNGAWAEALENAGGLCYNHLHQAIQLSPNKAAASQLKALHQRLWQALIDHLDEFIRKHDYRFRDEAISDAEAEAIRRAIHVLTSVDTIERR